MEKKLLSALNGKKQKTPPVWFMRQAGRYLPEYKEIREKAGSFLNLCYNPELAEEVTLQPLKRFKLDAAILFADILLIPHALGQNLTFINNEGPKLDVISELSDIKKLKSIDKIHETLSPVYETVNRLSQSLPNNIALIGFAGAPWTVATYMIGGSNNNQFKAREFIYNNELIFDKLIEIITISTIEYLDNQIKNGAEVIKLFDSWSGSLTYDQFIKYVIIPTENIINTIKIKHPNIPFIGFPKGSGEKYLDFIEKTKVSGLALDHTVSLEWAVKNVSPYTTLQGNLDPILLYSDKSQLKESINNIIGKTKDIPFIFNVGDGLKPNTSIENIEITIKLIKKYR